jgi:hypothetical protein
VADSLDGNAFVALVLSEAAAMRRAQAPIWGCGYFTSSL